MDDKWKRTEMDGFACGSLGLHVSLPARSIKERVLDCLRPLRSLWSSLDCFWTRCRFRRNAGLMKAGKSD